MYYILRIMYMFYLIIMLSIIRHDTCIHHSNVCDIDRNACTLLFNLYMQDEMSLYCIFIDLTGILQ